MDCIEKGQGSGPLDFPARCAPESSAKSTDNAVTHVGVLKAALLQTAKEKLAGVNTNEIWTATRILFYTGSHRTYFTENLRKHLKL